MALTFGAPTALAISANSLASAAARSSAAVTTSTSVNVAQIWLTVSILTTAVAPTGGKQVRVYGYVSTDGTTYTGGSAVNDDVNGTDKALAALGDPTNLKLIGTVQLNAGANAGTEVGTFELTGVFGGPPPRWGIVLYNDAGTALGSAVSASYREAYYTP